VVTTSHICSHSYWSVTSYL